MVKESASIKFITVGDRKVKRRPDDTVRIIGLFITPEVGRILPAEAESAVSERRPAPFVYFDDHCYCLHSDGRWCVLVVVNVKCFAAFIVVVSGLNSIFDCW